MTSKTYIPFDTRKDQSGLPFLNPVFGNQMNQNGLISGISNIINDGGSTSQAEAGTTTSTTAGKLIDSTKTFTGNVTVGMSVENKSVSGFAQVTAVDNNTTLSLSSDIISSGQTYVINEIWPGTIVSGNWNFTDTGAKITLTNGENEDEATFNSNSNFSYPMSSYTSVTGKITLTLFDAANNAVLLSLLKDGSLVGSPVLINSFINPGDPNEQGFIIPLSLMGITNQTVNGFRLQLLRSGGAKPDLAFDDLAIEPQGSGAQIIFSAAPRPGQKFFATELSLSFADNSLTTLTDGTLQGLDYTKLLGVATLANGVIFQRIQNEIPQIAVSIRQLSDILVPGGRLIDSMDLNGNTFIHTRVKFQASVLLDGDKNDRFILIINDDLTGLDLFIGFLRGANQI